MIKCNQTCNFYEIEPSDYDGMFKIKIQSPILALVANYPHDYWEDIK